MKKALLTASMALTSVALAFAQPVYVAGQTAQQGTVNATALLNLLALAQTIVSRLIPFVVTLAVLAFFFFLVKFIFKGDNPEERKKSLGGMAWSVVALFVMVSIWGIVGFFGSLLGVGQGGVIPVPGVPTP